MSDIAKCSDEECPLKSSCYRYTAPESPFRQTYLLIKYDWEKKECEYHLPVYAKGGKQ